MTQNEIYDLIDKKALLKCSEKLFEFLGIQNKALIFREVHDHSYMFCGFQTMETAGNMTLVY